jgi:hypothetical protein
LTFVHSVVVSHSATGRPNKKPYLFNLLLDRLEEEPNEDTEGRSDARITDPRATGDDGEGNDGEGEPPSETVTVTITSLTDIETAKVAPIEAMVALNGIRSNHSDDHGEALAVARISGGTLVLSPRQFGTTRATLTATITDIGRGAAPTQRTTSKSTFMQTALAGMTLGTARTGRTARKSLGSVNLGTARRGEDAEADWRSEDFAVLDVVLAVIPNLHAHFARYGQIDEATLSHFETVGVPRAPPSTFQERELIATSQMFDSPLRRQPWSRLPGTVLDSIEFYQRIESGESGWGKAVLTVDTSAARAFAWLWCLETYERTADYANTDGPDTFHATLAVRNSHSKLHASLVHIGVGFDPLVVPMQFTWERDELGGFLVAFAPMEGCADTKCVKAMDTLISTNERASTAKRTPSRGLWRILPLAPAVCKVTLVIQGNIGGKLPLPHHSVSFFSSHFFSR